MAVQYEYINVAQPDQGIDRSQPAPDISARCASDCQNVFFQNGEIRKRFGYGSAKNFYTIDPNALILPSGIQGHPIIGMTTYQNTLGGQLVGEYIYTFTTHDAFQASDDYHFLALTRYTDIENTGATWTARSGHETITFSGAGLNDCYFSYHNLLGADFVVRVKIHDAGVSPDVFIWGINADGDAWSDVTDWFTGAGFGAEAGATHVNCAVANILLNNGATEYCYVRFNAIDGHTDTNYWQGVYDYGANAAAADAGTPYLTVTPVKLTVAAAFSYGAIASQTLANTNHAYVGVVRAIVRSDVALAIADWKMVLYDNVAVAGCTDGVDLIPHAAVPVNTWTLVDFCAYDGTASGGYAGLAKTLASWSATAKELEVKMLADKGACNIWLADVLVLEAVNIPDSTWNYPAMTTVVGGSFDGVLGNYMVWTISSDAVYYGGRIRYQRGTNLAYLADDALDYQAAGIQLNALHQAKVVTGFKYHLTFMNGYEVGTGSTGVRVRWSDLVLPEVWDIGTSGHVDLPEGGGWIQDAIICKGDLYIFKTESIVRAMHLGGETAIFRWDVVAYNEGLKTTRLLGLTDNAIAFAGMNNINTFDGSALTPIGDQIKDAFYDGFDAITYKGRCHAFRLDKYKLLLFMRPVTGASPDRAWVYDYVRGVWTVWDFSAGSATNITAGCSYHHLGTTELSGTIFGTNEGEIRCFDFTSKNDGANAISAYWDSKDFYHPTKGRTEYTRWRGIHFEAKGDSVTASYSVDGGTTWTAIETNTLTTAWTRYFADINVESQLLRIRFSNNTLSSTFSVRWFSLSYEKGVPN